MVGGEGWDGGAGESSRPPAPLPSRAVVVVTSEPAAARPLRYRLPGAGQDAARGRRLPSASLPATKYGARAAWAAWAAVLWLVSVPSSGDSAMGASGDVAKYEQRLLRLLLLLDAADSSDDGGDADAADGDAGHAEGAAALDDGDRGGRGGADVSGEGGAHKLHHRKGAQLQHRDVEQQSV